MVKLNVEIIWSKLLDILKEQLTSLSYNTWFKETELYKLNNGKAYIIVPMIVHKKHISDNFSEILSSILFDITNTNYDLVFLVWKTLQKHQPKRQGMKGVTLRDWEDKT